MWRLSQKHSKKHHNLGDLAFITKSIQSNDYEGVFLILKLETGPLNKSQW